LSRIINVDSVGKGRIYQTKGIILAIRELALKKNLDDEVRDLAAFIAIALGNIHKSIEVTASAWEKRDYWVKADKFRLEWNWSGQLEERMKKAIREENWTDVALIATLTAQKLNKVTISPRNRIGRPWEGAWNEFKKRENKR
jgi:hypothetical protein